MARTPLASFLQRLVSDRRGSQGRRQQLSEPRPPSLSRRDVLLGATALGAGSLLAAPRAMAAVQPRIAIVGGGLAGLTAALTLRDAGLVSTIYEAHPNRIGGRMLSDRSVPYAPACGSCHAVSGAVPATWAEGQVTDVFGELIDSDHRTMLELCSRFGLPLTDLLAAQPAGSTDTYFFNNTYYPYSQAERDFAPVWNALRRDLREAKYPTLYNHSTAAGRALDAMSLAQWIDSRVPGGRASMMGQLLDVAYTIEYGAETEDQSALNLVYLLGEAPRGRWAIYGPSDEKYRISGGVDLLTDAIAGHLRAQGVTINLDSPLTAVATRADGSYQLSFEGTASTVVDYLVLALPFAALRNVSLAAAGFDALKLRAITELGAGKNGKVQLQFNTRYWTQPGPWGRSNGSVYADTGLQVAWEATRGQGGQGGVLLKYTGGNAALAMNLRHPYGNAGWPSVQADARQFLTELEPVFPGISTHWNGRCAGAMPHLNPWFGCSYSYWRVGQYQTIGGYEKVRQGNVLFSGEHTSQDFQGFMEGAASEGVRVGAELAKELRGGKKK